MSFCPQNPRLALALLVSAACFALTHGALADPIDGRWVELGAPARQDHTLIFDAVNQRLVVFGGRSTIGSNLGSNAVHFLDLATNEWSRAEPAGPAPAGRYGHAAVYDPVRQRMVMFGGYNGVRLNDAWALSLDATPTWTELSPAGGLPAARLEFVGVYDSMRDRMIVHGGSDASGLLDDTWALSFAGGESWAIITPSGTAAPARAQHAGAYDPVRDRLLFFGGAGDVNGETWALDLGTQTWDTLATSGGPPAPRAPAVGIYDPLHDAFVVIGGYPSLFTVQDTRALALAGTPTWTQKTSPGRRGAAACWVPALQGVAVHGGYAFSFTHTSTVRLDPGQFSSVSTLNGGGPWLRRDSEGIFDPVRNRLVIYGGDAASGFDTNPTADTWSMTAALTYPWTELSQYVPYHRIYHTLIRDPVGDRMILFAGDGVYGSDQWLDDTWSFDLSTNVWTELAFTGQIPGSHRMHTSIYDPVGQRMVVFGGLVDGDYSNDLWQLDLSGTPAWSLLAASGTPPEPRLFHAAVYDPTGHRMLVFDGSGPFTFPIPPLPESFNDLWELSLDNPPVWRQLAPEGSSPGGEHSAQWRAVSDPVRHRVIVFGRNGAMQLVLTDPPKWAPLVTTGPAPSRVPGQPLVYDPNGDRLLVFGANNSDATMALELDPIGTVSTSPAPASPRFAIRRVAPNPARTSFTISFDLPRQGRVEFDLLDVAGRRITSSDIEVLPGGSHSVTLRVPGAAAPGIYFARVRLEDTIALSKVVVIR